MAESSNLYETFLEHAKSIMAFKSEKIIEQPSRTNKLESKTLANSKLPKDKKDPKLRDEPTPLAPIHLPKTPCPSALETHVHFNRKGGELDKILELFKQVHINLLLVDIIKQVPACTKSLKDLCT